MNQSNITVVDRTIVCFMWLMWVGSVAVGILISIEDMQYIQTPQKSMHYSQKELDVHEDESTHKVTFRSKNRPLYRYEEFEPALSLGRSPKRSSESFWILIAFVLASQFLILWHVPTTPYRWVLFMALLLLGTLWTWYQVTYWLQWANVTFKSKLLGDPIGLLGLPTIFFCFVAGNHTWTRSGKKICCLIVIEALLIYPWLYFWGFSELVLGWMWI